MKIAFLGDIALIGKYDLEKNINAKKNLKKVAEFLKKYDYIIGNLETPLTTKKKSLVCKSMHLRSSPKNVEILKYLNISAVSLANNHIYDFGREGLNETIRILEENNINYFGVDGKEITTKEFNINGYCCYSTNAYGYSTSFGEKGVNTLTYKEIIKKVKEDNKKDKISILSMHWGDEHTNYPRLEHILLAEKIKEHNKIIISGHHPHVIQGVDGTNDSLVAYSQGNFCFDDCKAISGTGLELKQNKENRESFILDVTINRDKKINYKNIGIKELNGEIIFSEIENKIKKITNKIKKIKDKSRYQKMRTDQFSNKQFRVEKFGKKNIMWYLKRINYFAIGALIISKINQKKYKRVLLSKIKK